MTIATQSDILAHADRWIGATLTIPGEADSTVVRFRRGCCGAIRVRGWNRLLDIPSLAWVEGNPALDDVLVIRSPASGIVCVLKRGST